jgi:hypothetical protein
MGPPVRPLLVNLRSTLHGYGSLSLFSIVWFFVWVLWIFLLIRIIGDVFRSPDLSGAGRAGWTLLLVAFPFAGALLYLIFRGSNMHTRENRHAVASEYPVHRHFEQSAAVFSSADEITKLAALRQQGLLSETEFAGEKARVLSSASVY